MIAIIVTQTTRSFIDLLSASTALSSLLIMLIHFILTIIQQILHEIGTITSILRVRKLRHGFSNVPIGKLHFEPSDLVPESALLATAHD